MTANEKKWLQKMLSSISASASCPGTEYSADWKKLSDGDTADQVRARLNHDSEYWLGWMRCVDQVKQYLHEVGIKQE